MKDYIHSISFLFVTLFFTCSTSFAGSAPQITSASAAFVDSGANIRVQWQAEEPITKVFISIGTERKVIDVDFRDNSRTPSGIGGEATAVIPVTQGGTVSIQIEDEYRRKSEAVNINITGQRQTQSFGLPQGAFQHGMPTQDDSWGKENLSRTRTQLPELKVGQGQPGMPAQFQDPPLGLQQQPQGIIPQMQGGMMPPPMPPMQAPPINTPPPLANQPFAPPPPMPQNMPNMTPPPPPMPMDPGMIPPPPPPPPPPLM